MKKVGAERKKQIKKEERDISEKVALGQAQPTHQDLAYDQRLFDNAGGLEAGNSDSEDDHLYDKPLFADRSALHAQTVSSGAKDKATRTAPVQFEMHKESIFGMNDLLSQPQKKHKQ
jgi:SNW domain-containing protein 1